MSTTTTTIKAQLFTGAHLQVPRWITSGTLAANTADSGADFYWDTVNTVWTKVPSANVPSIIADATKANGTETMLTLGGVTYATQKFRSVTVSANSTLQTLLLPLDNEFMDEMILPRISNGSYTYVAPVNKAVVPTGTGIALAYNGQTKIGTTLGCWTSDVQAMKAANGQGSLWIKSCLQDKNGNLWLLEHADLAGMVDTDLEAKLKDPADYMITYAGYFLIPGFGWVSQAVSSQLKIRTFPTLWEPAPADTKVYIGLSTKQISPGITDPTIITLIEDPDYTSFSAKQAEVPIENTSKIILPSPATVATNISGNYFLVPSFGWLAIAQAASVGFALPQNYNAPAGSSAAANTTNVYALATVDANQINVGVMTMLYDSKGEALDLQSLIGTSDVTGSPKFDGYISVPGYGVTGEGKLPSHMVNKKLNPDIVHPEHIHDARVFDGAIIRIDKGKHKIQLIEENIAPAQKVWKTPNPPIDSSKLKSIDGWFLIRGWGWARGEDLPSFGYTKPAGNKLSPSAIPAIYGLLVVTSAPGSNTYTLEGMTGSEVVEVSSDGNSDGTGVIDVTNVSLSRLVAAYEVDNNKPLNVPSNIAQALTQISQGWVVQVEKVLGSTGIIPPTDPSKQ